MSTRPFNDGNRTPVPVDDRAAGRRSEWAVQLAIGLS